MGEGNVVLDFSHSSYGMELWGDYWILSNFTIRNTVDGKKGLQIAGNHNIIQFIIAEYCGDTGIQKESGLRIISFGIVFPTITQILP